MLIALEALFFPAAVRADDWADDLQCVPYAREISGISLYGDAHTWWDQADGVYTRGPAPIEGAVLSLPGHGKMELGHVAVVREIVDDRHVRIDHANWSTINGRRGQIERNVLVRDVSAANDWSEVKIWYTPIAALGKTAYPVNGFIYPHGKRGTSRRVAVRGGHRQATPRRNLLAKAKLGDLQQGAAIEASRAPVGNAPTNGSDPIGDLIALHE